MGIYSLTLANFQSRIANKPPAARLLLRNFRVKPTYGWSMEVCSQQAMNQLFEFELGYGRLYNVKPF